MIRHLTKYKIIHFSLILYKSMKLVNENNTKRNKYYNFRSLIIPPSSSEPIYRSVTIILWSLMSKLCIADTICAFPAHILGFTLPEPSKLFSPWNWVKLGIAWQADTTFFSCKYVSSLTIGIYVNVFLRTNTDFKNCVIHGLLFLCWMFSYKLDWSNQIIDEAINAIMQMIHFVCITNFFYWILAFCNSR